MRERRGAALVPLLFFSLVLLIPSAARSAAPEAEIETLLARVDGSSITFVRNGKAYDGHKAADHLRRKYAHFKPQIRTAEDFIRLCGTKSELSGKPYLVKTGPEKEERCADWLTALLKTIRTDGARTP